MAVRWLFHGWHTAEGDRIERLSLRTMIRLRTLGGLDLHDSQGRELRAIFAASKGTALLTYLAIATPRGFHRRDTLLALLWPELDQEHGRGALRQALRLMRRSMTEGALLTEGDDAIALDRELFWCDAVAFELLLDGGKEEEAMTLYRGELLEGFHLSGCLEFERWLEDERRRLKRRAAQATWSLVEQAEAQGNLSKAGEWARWASAIVPNDETALRRLITLLDRAGNRAGAIREYEAFAERLREDYEAEPAPETTELIAAVRARVEVNDSVLPSAPLTKQPVDAAQASVTIQPRPSWRTRGRAAAAIVVLGAILAVGATVIRNGRGGAPALDPTRVLVDIFQNETGDPSLDPLGRIAADRVTAGLTNTTFVDVVSLGTRLLSREPVVADASSLEHDDLQALARANGTGTVVWGSYYLEGDSVHFLAHVTDAATGEELATLEPVVGAIDAPFAAIEQLRDQVMTTLATLTDPRLAKWMRYASQPPTFEAYTEFVEGIELHTHGKARQALPHFLAAAALDSTFTMAPLWAYYAATFGQMALGDSILQALNRRRGQLAPLDRLLLDSQLASRRGDYQSALEAMRRFVEIAPGSEFLYKAGAYALAAGRPREAVEFLERADPESGWLRGWYPYWVVLAQAYHWVGDHERQLEAARRARRLFPDEGFIKGSEIAALAALGRTDEVQALLEESQETGLALYAATELLVHDHPEVASRVLDRGIMRHQAWLSAPRTDTTSRQIDGGIRRLADMLMLQGRVHEARVVLERAVGERGDSPFWGVYVRTLGVIAGMQGDRQRALDIYQDLGARPGAAPWHQSLYQARIAASLGEIDTATALLQEAVGNGLLVRAIHHQMPLVWRVLRDHPPFQELIRPKG